MASCVMKFIILATLSFTLLDFLLPHPLTLSQAWANSASGLIYFQNVVDGKYAGHCNGTLVGDGIILTNLHCFSDPQFTVIEFRIYNRQKRLLAKTNCAKPVAYDIFGFGDYIFLQCTQRLPAFIRPIKLKNAVQAIVNRQIVMPHLRIINRGGGITKKVHRGSVLSDPIFRQTKSGENVTYAGFTFDHNLRSINGSSGSMIFAADTLQPLGLNSHRPLLGGNNYGFAYSLVDILEEVEFSFPEIYRDLTR